MPDGHHRGPLLSTCFSRCSIFDFHLSLSSRPFEYPTCMRSESCFCFTYHFNMASPDVDDKGLPAQAGEVAPSQDLGYERGKESFAGSITP